MTHETWSIILFVLMFGLIALGVPVAFSLAISGAVILAFAFDIPLILIPARALDVLDAWVWVAIPLFLIVGYLMNASGVTGRLVDFAQSVVGHVSGGLSHVSVATNTMLAGMSGSLIADCAAVGSILIPPMKEKGFPPGYCAAIVACGSLIGPLIPPSINFIIIGTLINTSILRMWLGGVIPGLIVATGLITAGYIISKRKGYAKNQRAPVREMVRTFTLAIPALVIPVGIMGGLRLGIFTPTEAGSATVLYILLIGFGVYRSLTIKGLGEASLMAAKNTGTIGAIIAGGSVFGAALSMLGTGSIFAKAIIGVSPNPVVFMCAMVALLLFLGTIIEVIPLILIFVPLFLPVVQAFEINLVYFGVVFGYTSLVGSMTPPIGLAMYLSCSIAKTNVVQYTKHGWPFLGVLFAADFIFVLFPQTILWIPKLVMGLPM
ncbi:TRAP transporter large permease [Chloroflexota bacterium]